jgi:ferredoxin-like protein FixX
VVTDTKPLEPHCEAEATTDVALPDISPMNPFVFLWPKNVYNPDQNFPIKVRFSNCVVLQGCKMVCFQTKNTNLGKFWSALEWKMQSLKILFLWQKTSLSYLFSTDPHFIVKLD